MEVIMQHVCCKMQQADHSYSDGLSAHILM